MTTSRRSSHQASLPLISGVQDGPAKTSVTPTVTALVSAANGVVYFTHSWILLERVNRSGSSWRMCRGSSRQTAEPLLRQLSSGLKRMGIWGGGFRATSPMRAFPTTGIAYSLSQVISRTVPISSLLTATNCLGILRRERRAGRALDPVFEAALTETVRLWSSVAEVSDIPRHRVFAPRFAPKLEDIKAAIRTDRFCVARNLTWDECERLMGFPEGWTAVAGDSLATPSPPLLSSGSGDASLPSKRTKKRTKRRGESGLDGPQGSRKKT